ncbi:M16 family metallopeptidase [Taibaiella koreensis]|uniref:M16 family metallopeptidase n=1 Tax=Taibaiella koreensis TaxID=1268548 RepID=UPI000E59C600|nr:pitrilysin family protein [Taibaiella koreensis]
MKKTILSIAAAASLFSPGLLHAQAKLVEKVTQKGKEPVIPYERYVLPNGLTLLIHEDHSDPLVHVDVTYHVGSAREEIGKSGFAHFFEHMMFQGSDNVADEQHFKVITEAGGTLNGTTNRDRTNYFETVPANQLEKMLWLEADRMGFLLDAVTQQKFEVQRATVKNERGQRYDNQPYGLVNEVTARNLYPYGHPYSWLTIGYIEDLNRVNAQDLKNFFLRWYGPNNAVLTVGGDVQPKQVIAWVEKYFGPIPKGPDVKPVALPIPVLDKDRYVSMTDNYAKLPMLRMTYPVPPAFHKDQPALECLADILGDGKSSLFYKNLIKTSKAVNATVYNNDHGLELAGEFIVSVTPYPGQRLADIEKLVRETFAEFEKRGATDQDIAKFRNSSEARMIYSLESVPGKVSQLAAFYTFTGNPNYIGKELKEYTSVTKEDVMRVYNQYIKGRHAVIVSVLTKGNETNKAGEDNYTVSQAGYKAPNYGYDKLKYNKAKDNFDRKQMPAAGNAVVIKAPAFWQSTIDNSIKVIGTQTDEIPAVNLILHFKGGKMTDPADKNGTANLFATMMNEDTKNYTAEAFSQALEQLGSSITISASDDEIVVQVRSLSKNLDKTMQLLEERLLHPQFTAEDFGRNQKRLTESVKSMLNQPVYVASTVFNRLLNGPDNPLGRPLTGTEATIANITLEDIKNYYDNRFTKIGAEVVVVGDVAQNAILAKLDFLKQLSNVEVMPSMLPSPPPVGKTKVYYVHIPGAAQTEFRVGIANDMRYDATGPFYRSTIMNYPLGGTFNSRLNLYLREDKGWTYGARSNFTSDKYEGNYTFSAGIKAAATDSALNDVLRILSDYRTGGATAEELSFTQNSITLSEARKYETGIQKAGFLGNILTYGLPANYTEQQNAILKGLTVAEMKTLAAQHLPDRERLVVLLVGDKSLFADQLKAKGFELVALDREGKPVE